MIREMEYANLLELDFKRGSHVFVDVPFEGGKAVLEYAAENQGYGLLTLLDAEHDTFSLMELPAAKAWEPADTRATGGVALGDMWDFIDETAGVTWHFVYTHSIAVGYFPLWYADNNNEFVAKLDGWWDENEEDIPFGGVHGVLFGHGVYHPEVGRYAAIKEVMLRFQANTEIEFILHWWEE